MTALAFALDIQSGLGWAWILLATGAALGVLAWLYRRLFHLYPGRQAARLMALKAAAALLLLVALLRPVLVREEQDLARSRIVVLVDDSRSMATRDGTLGAARIEEARLVTFQKVLPALKGRLPATALRFDDQVASLESPEQLNATGEWTDILGALSRGARGTGPSGSPAAFVLITDGGDDEALPKGFDAGAPVYAVAIGSDLAHQNDLRIDRVQHPDRVDEQTSFEIQVEASASGSPAFLDGIGKAVLTVEVDGKAVATQPVELGKERQRQTLSLKLTAPTCGVHRCKLSLPEVLGEAAPLNNTRSFTLEVTNPTLRVLYFSGSLGQEFKAFRNAVKSDPGIHFTGMVRTGRDRFLVLGQKPGDAFGESFPASKKLLAPFRCVVLSGCPSDSLPPQAHVALLDFVSNGGVLVLLGGPDAFGHGGWAGTALAPLFPWELSPSEAPYRMVSAPVELSPFGRAHDVFRNLSDRFEAGAGQLRIDGYNTPGPLKPGAQALAELPRESGGRTALIALSHYGRGQVLGIASDALWRWGQTPAQGQALYTAFWRQAIRALTGGEQNGRLLKLETDRDEVYPVGATAIVSAHVLDRELRPHSNASLTAALRDETGRAKCTVTFKPSGTAGEYIGSVDAPEAGAYRLEVSASDQEGLLETRELLLEVGNRTGEGERLAVNRAWLESLAARTGGRVFDANETGALIDALNLGVHADVVRRESSLLWDSPWFFLIFLAVLSAEWIARRRMNLF